MKWSSLKSLVTTCRRSRTKSELLGVTNISGHYGQPIFYFGNPVIKTIYNIFILVLFLFCRAFRVDCVDYPPPAQK